MSIADAGLAGAYKQQHQNHKPVPEVPTKARICLKCRKEFSSTGPSNRICPDCNERNLRYGRRMKDETAGGRHLTNRTLR